jgi:uncharacterized protein YndB with AHSA1/START domain
MTVLSVRKDPEQLSMTITSEFAAPIERVWRMWDDPRQLERWWGPPTYPATFVEHDLTAGGTVTYFMTGPDGDTPRGWWRVTSVDAPRRLEFLDGFADAAGEPNPDMPTMTMRVTLQEDAGGVTTMSIETVFPSLEVMEQMASMGMEEGITEAVGQIDDLLSADVSRG